MAFNFVRLKVAWALCAVLAGTSYAQLVVPTGGSVDVPPGGGWNLGCGDLDVQGRLAVSSGQVVNVADLSIGSTGSVHGGTGTISLSGIWSNVGSFAPGTGSVVFNEDCGAGQVMVTGRTVFNNLTMASPAGRTFVLPEGGNTIVNGTLTLQGAAGQPVQLESVPGETAVVHLGSQANVVQNFASVAPTVHILAAAVAPQAIPTLGEYGVMALSLLLAATVFWRRGRAKACAACASHQLS